MLIDLRVNESVSLVGLIRLISLIILVAGRLIPIYLTASSLVDSKTDYVLPEDGKPPYRL
jgi:phage shock protein PspC (stress-responsive transcriptional regulator)